jgi:hypothetical protein
MKPHYIEIPKEFAIRQQPLIEQEHSLYRTYYICVEHVKSIIVLIPGIPESIRIDASALNIVFVTLLLVRRFSKYFRQDLYKCTYKRKGLASPFKKEGPVEFRGFLTGSKSLPTGS